MSKDIQANCCRVLLAGVALVVSANAAAQGVDQQAICANRDVINNFRLQMRSWSLQQIVFAKRIETGDAKGTIQWLVKGAEPAPASDGVPAGLSRPVQHQASETFTCKADFEYMGTSYLNGFNPGEHFLVKDVIYTVTVPYRADGGWTMSFPGLPDSIDTDDKILPMKDRIYLAGYSVGELLERAKAPKTPAPPRPQNAVEAYAALEAEHARELEAELRRQGMGDLIDAENARRAKLTPAQRATEDAWNRGPAKGETICKTEDGITHCKTG